MRLIDADELIEEIKSMRVWLGGKDIFPNEAKESIIQLIEDEPTAYDIDKVVEGLEREKDIHTEHFNNSIYKDMPEIKQRYSQALGIIDKAIEIVKGE